jgi:hypothetical protein
MLLFDKPKKDDKAKAKDDAKEEKEKEKEKPKAADHFMPVDPLMTSPIILPSSPDPNPKPGSSWLPGPVIANCGEWMTLKRSKAATQRAETDEKKADSSYPFTGDQMRKAMCLANADGTPYALLATARQKHGSFSIIRKHSSQDSLVFLDSIKVWFFAPNYYGKVDVTGKTELGPIVPLSSCTADFDIKMIMA